MTDRPAIILFDGVCLMCNATVRFVFKRDPNARFMFAPIQSEAGQQLIQQYGLPDNNDTVILIEHDAFYVKSTAALRIARQLKAPWSLMAVFLFVPKVIRDAVYDFIGRHRYRWFGQSEQCVLPSEALAKRFLK